MAYPHGIIDILERIYVKEDAIAWKIVEGVVFIPDCRKLNFICLVEVYK